MGWLKGFEPSSNGATIRRVNRFTTATMFIRLTTKVIIPCCLAYVNDYFANILYLLLLLKTKHQSLFWCKIKMATPAGFEPATFWFVVVQELHITLQNAINICHCWISLRSVTELFRVVVVKLLSKPLIIGTIWSNFKFTTTSKIHPVLYFA